MILWLATPALAGPFLPLESLEWRVDVTGPVARVEVVETFRNTTDGLVDAVYVFPLAPGAAIDALHIRIGTREIDGTVKAREAARAEYEAARAEGRTAVLTEQQRADVFTQDVANLPPGEAIVVRFSVVQPVGRGSDDEHGDHWALTLPLLSPPRFVPLGSPTVLAALSAESPRDVGVRADVVLTVQAGRGVRDLWAEPLPRDVRPDLLGSAARLHLDGLPLDADLQVGWRTARDRAAAALLVSDTHALLVSEAGRQQPLQGGGVDWSRCPVTDETQLPGAGDTRVARRLGPCDGPVHVGATGTDVWPQRVVDAHTLGSMWARGWVGALERRGAVDQVRAVGLEYGIVTSQTSFVAVDGAGPAHQPPRRPALAWDVTGGDTDGDGLLDSLDRFEPIVAHEKAKKQRPAKLEEELDDAKDYDQPSREEVEVYDEPEAGFAMPIELAPEEPNLYYAMPEAKRVQVVEQNIVLVEGATGENARGPLGDDDARRYVPEGHVAAAAPAPGAPVGGWSLDARSAGPVVPDHLWVDARGSAARVDPGHLGDPGAAVDTRALGLEVHAERRDLRALVTADTAAGVADAGRFGATALGARAGGTLEVDAGFDRVWLGDEAADRVTAGGAVRGQSDGPWVTLGATATQWSQRGPEGDVARWLSVGRASAEWSRRVHVTTEAAAHVVGGGVAVAPWASASGGSRTAWALQGGRRVDVQRVAPGGPIPSAWEADGELSVGVDARAFAGGAVVRDSAVFVPSPAFDPLPGRDHPTTDRTVPSLRAGFDVPWTRGWLAAADVTWRPLPADLVAGLDPRAPFVPGWLELSRPYALGAALGAELPIQRAPLQVVGSVAHQGPIDASGPWWLRAATTWALTLDETVWVRDDRLHFVLAAAHTRGDLARAPVPAEVLALAPVDLDAWSPWRLTGTVRFEF